jgi:hypothetical protein
VAASGRGTDAARLVDVAGHDAHLAPERVDHARAVRAHEARLALRRERLRDLRRRGGARGQHEAHACAHARTLISSAWGMPSVMQTMRPTSFSIASRMASAANGGGT